MAEEFILSYNISGYKGGLANQQYFMIIIIKTARYALHHCISV